MAEDTAAAAASVCGCGGGNTRNDETPRRKVVMDDDTLPRATNKGMTAFDIDDNDDSAAMAAGVDVILL